MTNKILVVDDDPHIVEVICFALKKADMAYEVASNGTEGLAKFNEVNPDLIVLDVGMPELDGLEVCREIRKTSDTPILFLSARDEEIDRILGLEIGGDDYVTKPFSPRELTARINRILKRSKQEAPAATSSGTLKKGDLALNPEEHKASFDGEELTLTAIEFNILKAFLTQPERVFTRDQIMNRAYTQEIYVSDRTIDSHIRNIRSKLKKKHCEKSIETVHGVGFRLGSCRSTLDQ